MYIFSKDGETFVNSEKVKYFEVIPAEIGMGFDIVADEVYLGIYDVKEDAVKELNNIFTQLITCALSYQLR